MRIKQRMIQHSLDILRTVFVHQQLQKPRQVVLAERKTKVHYEDISHADENRQKEHIERYKQDVQRQGFNLAKDILQYVFCQVKALALNVLFVTLNVLFLAVLVCMTDILIMHLCFAFR